VFFFLPGGMGIAFLKQYKDAGVDLPLVGPAFSFDQNILQAVGDAALGVRNTSQWNKDLDNLTNREFVAAFQAEYGRLPSLYASQGYDAANLLLIGKPSARRWKRPISPPCAAISASTPITTRSRTSTCARW